MLNKQAVFTVIRDSLLPSDKAWQNVTHLILYVCSFEFIYTQYKPHLGAKIQKIRTKLIFQSHKNFHFCFCTIISSTIWFLAQILIFGAKIQTYLLYTFSSLRSQLNKKDLLYEMFSILEDFFSKISLKLFKLFARPKDNFF